MSNLETIVPPLELCKKIPAGEFADSALVWRVPNCSFPLEDEFYEIHQRDKCESWMKDKQIPAPTLQEIMEELTELQDAFRVGHDGEKNKWKVACSDYEDNAATAAIKAYFMEKGIEHAE